MNPVQRIVQGKISALICQAEAAGAIGHAVTVGVLRERYLTEFFRDLIPQNLSITSGIICDAGNGISKQIDFIVKYDGALPSLDMENGISVVPVESVFLTAEIKSTLTTDTLSQVSASVNSIVSLRLSIRPSSSGQSTPVPRVIIPTIILAYETSVSEDTLRDWLSQNANVIGVCIVGKYSVLRLNTGITLKRRSEGDPEHIETLSFVSNLFHCLQELLSMRRINPNWQNYLEGVRMPAT